ncbi:glutamine-hydrolyzing GMP synthase [Candidatus Haliotispira prima]|uniref:GMP synthase (glutamine-hydrolyzing) n=1 Tax=Candidatus Haliotispira prima TaxID=3034016 RepID=A0ABY8MKG9_9SPIO|nr:glutamine-hydrolyzing GMP synthase [Candidatus Haliotispira prima]
MKQILVVDFGGQTSHLICRRLRDSGVYAQVISPLTPVFQWFQDCDCDWRDIRGLIFSGSPFSVYAQDAPRPHRQILALAAAVPTLGICYGLHWLTQHLGGQVKALEHKEYGPNPVKVLAPQVLAQETLVPGGAQDHTVSPILAGVPDSFVSWMSHADSLQSLPRYFTLLAESEQGLPAIIRSEGLKIRDSALYSEMAQGLAEAGQILDGKILDEEILDGEWELYGFQFHPEASHCESGSQFLANFALSVCGCDAAWALESWEKSVATEIKEQVADAPVVLLISGGVDSSVVAALLLRYLPAEQIHLLYFDTGLMRLGETAQVVGQLTELGAKYFRQVDAQKEFISALANVSEPEQKRRIIGDLFIQIQEQEICGLFPENTEYFLAQGTLYTDMIESGMGVGKYAAVIKSHHNVSTPLVRKLREQKRLVEPLATLYKDEVRRLGENLGLSREITRRQPFPGPGLAIRILGDVTAEKLDLLRGIDHLYLETLRELGIYGKIWQAFAVLLPVQSVGVTGDSRSYGPVIALRAITSVDGMSAEVYPFRHDQLQKISTRISNRFPEISRVVYDISAKPPATIEWE